MRALKLKLLFFLFFVGVNSYGQTPAIAWADISAGTFGGSFKSTKSGSNFFVLDVAATIGNRTLTLKKLSTEGVSYSRLLFQDNCSTCSSSSNILSDIIPTSDFGALVYYQPNTSQTILQKIEPDGTPAWTTSLSGRDIIKVVAGPNKSVIVLSKITSGTPSGVFILQNLNASGSSIWTKTLDNNPIIDIVSTPDGGVLSMASDSTRSYNNLGTKRWAQKATGSFLRIIDNDEFLLVERNRIVKHNLTTGATINAISEIAINDVIVTPEKKIIVATATRIMQLTTGFGLEWSVNSGGQRLRRADNGAVASIGIGNNSNVAAVYSITGSPIWQKQFTYDLGNTLTIEPASDNGWYALTRGQVATKPNQHGTAFLYRILPTTAPCSYTIKTTPNEDQTYCQTGKTIFEIQQSNLDLSYGLPTTDYTVQWLKNNQPITLNILKYENTEEGVFSARVQQGNCSVLSQNVTIKAVGKQTPIATTDLIEQCLNGGVVSNLTTTGCTNSSVLWSNGATGAAISVTPTASTNYTSACVETYTQSGNTLSCKSKGSPIVSVNVLTQSNMQLVGINGPNVLCDGKTDTLKVVLAGVYYVPFKFEWTQNGQLITNNYTGNEQIVSESGNYQLKVKDRRGCTAQTGVKTLSKSQLAVSIDGNREFCQGISNNLIAKVSGGVESYKYDWRFNNTPFSTISTVDASNSGSYTLTVTDNLGCKKDAVAQVVASPSLTGAYKNRSIVKGNLMYDFNPNTIIGGTKPLNITLNAISASNKAVPVNNNTVGKFTENSKISIFVTDAKGCTLKDSILIDYVPCNVGVGITGDQSFCYYSNANLNATPVNGIRPFSYQWQQDNNNLSANTTTFKTSSAGNYSVILTDSANCSVTSAVFKVEAKGRDINAQITSSGDLSVYFPFGVSLSANTGTGYTYQWYRNDTLLTNQTSTAIEAKISGNYSVRIDKDGCRDTSNVLVVTILIPLGIENTPYKGNVTAFPNPMYEVLTIKSKISKPSSATCFIYDTNGKQLYQENNAKKVNEHEFIINVFNWVSGTYHYHIQTDEGTVTGKLVKR